MSEDIDPEAIRREMASRHVHDPCGALAPRAACGRHFHPDDPVHVDASERYWWRNGDPQVKDRAVHPISNAYTPTDIANAQARANRNTTPPSWVMTGRRPDGGAWDAVRMEDGTLVDRAADATSHAEQSGRASPARADESTAQTLTDDEIRWQVREMYAVGYGNSTGSSVVDHHLAGLKAVPDWTITLIRPNQGERS